MRKVARHFFVSGRVQGVSFRASTKEKAEELGLSGWVRNLEDGQVELVACGEELAIKKLSSWLWKGSKGSFVENIEEREIEFLSLETFSIHYS